MQSQQVNLSALESLPFELHLEISRYSSIASILSLVQSSKVLGEIYKSNPFWEAKYKKYFYGLRTYNFNSKYYYYSEFKINYKQYLTSHILPEEREFYECILSGDSTILKAHLESNYDEATQLVNKTLYRDNNSIVTPLAILIAKVDSSEEIIKILLKYNADANVIYKGKPIISIAIRQHKNNIVDILLDHGVNINAVDKSGDSLLLTAIKHKNIEVVGQLLKRGAKTNSKQLSSGINTGCAEIVEELLKHGANPNERANGIDYPLGQAIYKENIEMVETLLKHNADPDGCSIGVAGGHTPLIIALVKNNFQIIKVLLDNGASALRCDSFGSNIIWHANRQGNLEELLPLIDNDTAQLLKENNIYR